MNLLHEAWKILFFYRQYFSDLTNFISRHPILASNRHFRITIKGHYLYRGTKGSRADNIRAHLPSGNVGVINNN